LSGSPGQFERDIVAKTLWTQTDTLVHVAKELGIEGVIAYNPYAQHERCPAIMPSMSSMTTRPSLSNGQPTVSRCLSIVRIRLMLAGHPVGNA
jgi:hypothetical protein